MRKFTNCSYLLDKKARFHVWLGLVDIILAYVYDVRTTEGEHNVSVRLIATDISLLLSGFGVQVVAFSHDVFHKCFPDSSKNLFGGQCTW